MTSPRNPRSSVIPCLRYRDAPAAIEWLCAAFGFERHAVYPGDDGSILHAQLTLPGGGMVMLGSVPRDDAPIDLLQRQPDEVGGVVTSSPYLVVDDADAVFARAKAQGATTVVDIHSADYGGRGFSCRDPEGHVWHVGSYDPWQAPGD